MKILSVIDVMTPLFGGSSERVFQMSRHLGAMGVRVDTLTTNYCFDKSWVDKLQCGEVYVLDAYYCRYLFPFGVKKWLSENLHKYDAIHIAKNWSLLSTCAGKSAVGQGIPYVFSAMGFITIHNRSRMLKQLFSKIHTKRLLDNANCCIAVTKEEEEDLKDNGVPASKIYIVPNGIVAEDFNDLNSDYFRYKYSIGDKKILLFIGRMDPIKGVHLLLEAYKLIRERVQSWCLVLVGTKTEYRKYLEGYAISLGISDSVIFVDPIFGSEKSMAYHAAEIVVIPSIKDAMTIVAPEAAFCERPVLITQSSGFGALAKAGGAIEVEANSESIAKELLIMCNGGVNLKLMGELGKKFVAENLDWQVLSKKYYDIFSSCHV